MGEVYRAAHIGSGEIVAIKLLLGAQGVELLQRFRNEARIHAALRHPHIAAMREFIESNETPAIAMEYIDGDALDSRIRQRGALGTREALALFAPIADAVGYMHQRGVLHRDIKSSNVKIARDGTPKLLDFGIAKSAQSPKLTAAGAVIGTWHYLSPEQLRSGVAESRSDLWALGVLLYEMVTGRLPFDGGGVAQLTERILAADYVPASRVNRALPLALDRIIARCLTVRLESRYQSASALLTDVRELSGPAPIARVESTEAPAVSAPLRSPPWHFPALPTIPTLRVPQFAALRERIGAWPGRSGTPRVRTSAITATALVALVAVLAYTLTPRARDVGGDKNVPSRDTGTSLTPVASGSGADPTVFDYSPTRVTDSQSVSVTTLELPAEVWMDGKNVGTTPYTITRQLGSEVELVLKRRGYRDSVLRFPVLIGKPEYNIQLERRDEPFSPDPQPTDQPHLVIAGAAMFLRRLFGRGASPAPASIKSTRELGLMVDASGAPPLLDGECGVATDTGCVRTGNEDSILLYRPDAHDDRQRVGMLAVVCDGMGGHEGGEVASRLAIEEIIRHFGNDNGNPAASLERAVQQANRVVFEAAKRDDALKGMGTTCTALLVQGNQAFCSHVGDSRLYLVRDREIFLMTEDHSEVMELVRRGVISRDEARHHPDKNVILRALGVQREVQVASWPQAFGVRANDRFLVCSDGLYDLVEDADILDAVLSHGAQEACDHLVALARAHGGFDNISVGVLSMMSTSASALNATRAVEVMP
jgi:serine/threonine protein phosphatase PrpC/serine/threonine protein kinase